MSTHCFVPGCNTGYGNVKKYNKEVGLRNPSLFKPRTEEMVRLWARAIKRTDKNLTKKHAVCELHFEPSEIDRFYVTNLRDGTIFQLERGAPKLKEGAIPSIFNIYPRCLNRTIKKRKPVSRKEYPSKKSKSGHLQNEDSDKVIDIAATETTEVHSIKNWLKDIKLPSEYWLACAIEDTKIAFSCLNKDLQVITKRVIIYDDLSTEVFVSEVQVKIFKNCIDNIADIQSFLSEVDQLIPCNGSNYKQKSRNCHGFVSADEATSEPDNEQMCSSCKTSRQHLRRKKKILENRPQKQKIKLSKLKNKK